jgi:hypothetical protein
LRTGADEEVDAPPDWGAMMTSRQFAALESRLQLDTLLEFAQLQTRKRFRPGDAFDTAGVATWLRNGWSTEKLLRLNESVFDDRDRAFALHWAFPQAYYSVFAVTTVFFKTRGSRESTHAAVIGRVGENMRSGEYPPTISFLALGGPREIAYVNIVKHPIGQVQLGAAVCPGACASNGVRGRWLRYLRSRGIRAARTGWECGEWLATG